MAVHILWSILCLCSVMDAVVLSGDDVFNFREVGSLLVVVN